MAWKKYQQRHAHADESNPHPRTSSRRKGKKNFPSSPEQKSPRPQFVEQQTYQGKNPRQRRQRHQPQAKSHNGFISPPQSSTGALSNTALETLSKPYLQYLKPALPTLSAFCQQAKADIEPPKQPRAFARQPFMEAPPPSELPRQNGAVDRLQYDNWEFKRQLAAVCTHFRDEMEAIVTQWSLKTLTLNDEPEPMDWEYTSLDYYPSDPATHEADSFANFPYPSFALSSDSPSMRHEPLPRTWRARW